jgi:hypothetical protein
MIVILIGVLVLAGMDINLGVLHFLLGRDGHGQHGTILDTFHFYPGNGGSLAGVVKFPFHHQIGLAFLEQAASFNNISTTNHGFLA